MTEVKTEVIPSPIQPSKEELQFQQLMQFANLARHMLKNLNEVQPTSTFNKNYDKSEIVAWLANPQKYEKKLRDLSRFLFNSSTHYKRLIDYFATMLTFDYVVDVYNQIDYKIDENLKEIIQKKYIHTINFLEKMNMKHEFSNLMYKLLIDGVVYGYEYSSRDSFFFDILNPDYCAISSIEDGVYNFSFSFDYFDKYPKDLERFSDEFKQKYNIYKSDRKNNKWQELDSSRTICIKMSETDYSIPFLAGIFEEIYSLYTYKDLQMNKSELDNFLLLVAKIPYTNNKETANNFALSLDIANEYFVRMEQNLGDNIGAILSPFDSIEPIKLTKNEKELDTVTLAENSIYNSAGVPRLIFNSDKASGAALNKAILNDQTTMFRILRQVERWVNRKLKDENKRVYFKVSFLDITKYNQDDVVSMYKDASMVGLPVKTRYCAALGLSPSDMMNSMMLENDVLGIVDKFKPLQSAYQSSSDDKGGRDSKGDNIESTTETGQDNDSNNPENRA